MSKYLEESYDASLKEIEQLKVKIDIAQKAFEQILICDDVKEIRRIANSVLVKPKD